MSHHYPIPEGNQSNCIDNDEGPGLLVGRLGLMLEDFADSFQLES